MTVRRCQPALLAGSCRLPALPVTLCCADCGVLRERRGERVDGSPVVVDGRGGAAARVAAVRLVHWNDAVRQRCFGAESWAARMNDSVIFFRGNHLISTGVGNADQYPQAYSFAALTYLVGRTTSHVRN
jgi:hypothetical protein